MTTPRGADPTGTPRRKGFAPTVVGGIAAAGLTAVAANQTWATAQAADGELAFSTLTEPPQVPLVLTLALVGLASWGVLLVTRGAVRRVVAWLGVAAAAGAVLAAVIGRARLQDSLERDFAGQGATAMVEFGAWWWVAVAASLLATVATVLAALNVRRWPEMGTRYDAPGVSGEPAPAVPADQQTSLDLWKSLDEGRDPTA